MNEEYKRLNQENKEMNGNSTLPKVTKNSVRPGQWLTRIP